MPRTIPQAEALEQNGIDIDAAVSIEIEDEVIEKRMTGRRTCLNCGATYHVESKPPKVEGVCDLCGEKLTIRKDDSAETVRDRLAVYHKETEPLKDFYQARGKLILVDNQPTVELTTEKLLEALK